MTSDCDKYIYWQFIKGSKIYTKSYISVAKKRLAYLEIRIAEI